VYIDIKMHTSYMRPNSCIFISIICSPTSILVGASRQKTSLPIFHKGWVQGFCVNGAECVCMDSVREQRDEVEMRLWSDPSISHWHPPVQQMSPHSRRSLKSVVSQTRHNWCPTVSPRLSPNLCGYQWIGHTVCEPFVAMADSNNN